MGAIGTHTLIQKITVGSAGAASITFSSIPATYTDLCLKYSIRTNDAGTDDILLATVNSITTGYSNRILYGNGSAAGSLSNSYSTAKAFIGYVVGNGSTASTFGNGETFFPNYAGSTYKSWSSDSVNERNATAIVMGLAAGLLSNNAVISGLSLVSNSGSNFLQYSSVSLYGVTTSSVPASPTPQAQGGDIIVNDGTYWYHAFISTGAFVPKRSLTADVLVVGAGGGGGGGVNGVSYGSGAASGVVRTGSLSLASASNTTATIGAGGVGNSTTNGTSSVFSSITATGGASTWTSQTGGANADYSGAVGTGSAGGGGAGSAANGSVVTGGAGTNTYSSWLSVVGLGVSGYIAGGGGGNAAGTPGVGGSGGGGASRTNGTANTGSGGGAWDSVASQTNGGSGLIIIRYKI